MLPLSLLRGAQGQSILVELKNGETFNGKLVNCDSWMNINLSDVIHTSKDADRFWNVAECYIRGNTIKYLCIPDEILDKVHEEEEKMNESRKEENNNNFRGNNYKRGSGPNRGRGDSRNPRGGNSNRGSTGNTRGRGRNH